MKVAGALLAQPGRELMAVPWFNVDDSFYDHPKVWDAPDCAVALWCRAGSWSSRSKTDGFVPSGMPARLCGDPEAAVQELLDRGLWRRAKGGYVFHDWLDWNLSREQIERKRKGNAERQRRHRARLEDHQPDVTGIVTQDVTRDVTHDGRVSHSVQSNPSSVVYVSNQSSRRNARGEAVIDEITKTIYDTTNRVIDREWAEKIAGHILDGHKAGNPVAYVRAVIENEPDPYTRFLPTNGGAA
jgi:hypothetical protein